MKKINNDYDTNAHLWWSEDEGTFSSIRYFVHPVRVAYFREVMARMRPDGYAGLTALDVSAAEFLSEDLAETGLRVTGIDHRKGPSEVPATRRADCGSEYRAGTGKTCRSGTVRSTWSSAATCWSTWKA